MKINLNVNIMAARRRRGLTQKQLAAKAQLGLNHIDIVRIERYGWIPPRPIRQRLAEVLDSTESALFGEAIRTENGATVDA